MKERGKDGVSDVIDPHGTQWNRPILSIDGVRMVNVIASGIGIE